ncbi:MAG: hypothetical protein KAJ37_06705, partial [Candidatus Krumholzibacteria bacterium]|nr:hypothetical protein [Candidatus Krumholzibacteria bacterium]
KQDPPGGPHLIYEPYINDLGFDHTTMRRGDTFSKAQRNQTLVAASADVVEITAISGSSRFAQLFTALKLRHNMLQ